MHQEGVDHFSKVKFRLEHVLLCGRFSSENVFTGSIQYSSLYSQLSPILESLYFTHRSFMPQVLAKNSFHQPLKNLSESVRQKPYATLVVGIYHQLHAEDLRRNIHIFQYGLSLSQTLSGLTGTVHLREVSTLQESCLQLQVSVERELTVMCSVLHLQYQFNKLAKKYRGGGMGWSGLGGQASVGNLNIAENLYVQSSHSRTFSKRRH